LVTAGCSTNGFGSPAAGDDVVSARGSESAELVSADGAESVGAATDEGAVSVVVDPSCLTTLRFSTECISAEESSLAVSWTARFAALPEPSCAGVLGGTSADCVVERYCEVAVRRAELTWPPTFPSPEIGLPSCDDRRFGALTDGDHGASWALTNATTIPPNRRIVTDPYVRRDMAKSYNG
jgi:hypothetical protein